LHREGLIAINLNVLKFSNTLCVRLASGPTSGPTLLLENRPVDAAEIGAGCAPSSRQKERLCTLASLDGRTRASKRARELVATFEAELDTSITSRQRLTIERGATQTTLAEDAQARRLAGDQDVTLEDLVRIDDSAQRAVKALGFDRGAQARGSATVDHPHQTRRGRPDEVDDVITLATAFHTRALFGARFASPSWTPWGDPLPDLARGAGPYSAETGTWRNHLYCGFCALSTRLTRIIRRMQADVA
jgi:hypothetical protein